jgi:uncharacterized protein with von Willebrand factor type A (vWA) domain
MDSYSKAEYFYKNHGQFKGLIRFIEACNPHKSPNGKIIKPDLEKIGAELVNPITGSQVCRTRSELLEEVWRPKIGTLQFIKFILDHFDQENQERRELTEEIIQTKKNAELQLILGKAMNWIK